MKIIYKALVIVTLLTFFGIAGTWDFNEYQKHRLSQAELQDLYGTTN